MKTMMGLIFACTLLQLSPHAHAGNTTPDKQLETFISLSGKQPNESSGQEFFISNHGRDWSCSSCHTVDPTTLGKHAKSKKMIAPISPKTNPERFTDTAKTERWFRSDCGYVLGRECTPEEQADVLAWLSSLPK